MKLAASTMDGVLIITVGEPQVVAGNVEPIKAEISRQVAAAGGRLVLDLGPVSFLDSSGAGMLVSLMKSIARDGGVFRVAGLTAQPLALVRTVSLDRVIPLNRNVEEAMAALTGSRGAGTRTGECGVRPAAGPGAAAELDQMLAHVVLSYEAIFGAMPDRLASGLRDLFEREILGTIAQSAERAEGPLDAQIQAQRQQILGEMAAGMAARFKSSLNLVIGRIQFLRLVTSDETICGSLEIMEKAATQGLTAVRRIEEFAQGSSTRKSDRLPLRRLIDDALEMLRLGNEELFARHGRGVRIIRELMGSPTIAGCEAELKHALVGILLNAAEAMPEGGVLTVTVNQSGASATVQIADTGRGMDAEAVEKAFDPLYSTKRDRRTGLGLPIARSVFEKHGGSVRLESQQGKGTTVTIHLPALAEPARVEEAPPGAGAAAPQGAPAAARVLVVDDEPSVCDLMRDILSEMGYEVVVCQSGREALSHAPAGRFDLAMTDLAMPEMNGWEVARELRALDPQIPVALFSAWGSRMDAGRMREKGVDFLFPKPFEISMIKTIMASAIELGRERRTVRQAVS